MNSDRIISKIAATTVARTLGGVASFFLAVAVSRLFGAHIAGEFYLTLTLGFGLAILARFGYGMVLVKVLGAAGDEERDADAAYLQTILLCTIFAVIITSLAMGGLQLAKSLAPTITPSFYPALLPIIVIAGTLVQIAASAARGWHRPLAATTMELVALPLITLLALAAIGFGGLARTDVPMALIFTYGTVVILTALTGIAMTMAWHTPQLAAPLPFFAGAKRFADSHRKAAFNFLTVDVSGYVIASFPFLVLGFVATSETLGIYNAADRIAAMLMIIQFGVVSVASPIFARLNAQKDLTQLTAVTQKITAAMTIIGLLIAIAFWTLGDFMLLLFGAEFHAALPALLILGSLRALSFGAGPSLNILAMSGHDRRARNINVATAVIGALLTVILVPAFGVIGAALSTGIVVNLTRWTAAYYVWHDLGVRTMSLTALRGLFRMP